MTAMIQEGSVADRARIQRFIDDHKLVVRIRRQPWLGADVAWKKTQEGWEVLVYSVIAGASWMDRIVLLALADIVAAQDPWYELPSTSMFADACRQFLNEYVKPAARESFDLALMLALAGVKTAFAWEYLRSHDYVSPHELDEAAASASRHAPGNLQGFCEYVGILAAMLRTRCSITSHLVEAVMSRQYALHEALHQVEGILATAAVQPVQIIELAKLTYALFCNIQGTEVSAFITRNFGTRVYEFDIAISAASEDRAVADEIAQRLTAASVRVFYDRSELARSWGQDLYIYLGEIYGEKSRYCLLLLSQHYVAKQWTKHELDIATNKQASYDRVLLARVDDTALPGLESRAYVDLRTTSVLQLVESVVERLRRDDPDAMANTPGIETAS